MNDKSKLAIRIIAGVLVFTLLIGVAYKPKFPVCDRIINLEE